MKHDRVRLYTSLKPGFACGMTTVQIVMIDPGELATHLWSRHRIIVSPIKHAEFEGIRVIPNVYTTLDEIDRFVAAMEAVILNGLPSA